MSSNSRRQLEEWVSNINIEGKYVKKTIKRNND